MRKLSLQPDDLRVESFDTLPAAAEARNTVHAHQAVNTAGHTCPKTETCNATCPQTCARTCRC